MNKSESGGGDMPSPHPFDPAKYPAGSKVHIADRPALEEFARTLKLHHKLQSEQLDYAGRVATVVNSSMDHGGDVLYELDDVPGMWHERCLKLEPQKHAAERR